MSVLPPFSMPHYPSPIPHCAQVESLLPLLKRGIGVHHGGLLPILKEVVEILFQVARADERNNNEEMFTDILARWLDASLTHSGFMFRIQRHLPSRIPFFCSDFPSCFSLDFLSLVRAKNQHPPACRRRVSLRCFFRPRPFRWVSTCPPRRSSSRPSANSMAPNSVWCVPVFAFEIAALYM